MNRRRTIIAAIFLSLSSAAAWAQAAPSPNGTWLTQAGDARVKVGKCGTHLCGTIVWLRDPVDSKTGRPQIDDKNPDPARATRPVVGLSIFLGMRPTGPAQWSGHIYNADDGKTYESNVALLSADSLKVEGCVGPLCGSETWTRVSR